MVGQYTRDVYNSLSGLTRCFWSLWYGADADGDDDGCMIWLYRALATYFVPFLWQSFGRYKA